MKTYKLGDRIRFEIELTDESGVGRVTAVFRGEAPYAVIQMHGHGEGAKTATVELTAFVTDATLPGGYSLQDLTASDSLGNHRHLPIPAGLEFRVENEWGDYEGPELVRATLG